MALSHLSFGQSEKVLYPHRVFWHKTEIHEFKNEKWGLGADFILRTKNEFNKGSMFDAHLRTSLRPWLSYQFGKNARLSLSPLGYMKTTEYVAKPEDLLRAPYHEWRTTVQFFHHLKQANGRVMHTWRYRYEARWQERSNDEGYRFLNRFRLRYRIRIMLNSDDFYENRTLYFAGSNEIGLNFGKNVVYNTFNQNRLYLGLGYRFQKAARIEVRYLNRYRTRGATGYEMDHSQGLMIALFIDQLSGLWKSDNPKVRFSD